MKTKAKTYYSNPFKVLSVTFERVFKPNLVNASILLIVVSSLGYVFRFIGDSGNNGRYPAVGLILALLAAGLSLFISLLTSIFQSFYGLAVSRQQTVDVSETIGRCLEVFWRFIVLYLWIAVKLLPALAGMILAGTISVVFSNGSTLLRTLSEVAAFALGILSIYYMFSKIFGYFLSGLVLADDLSQSPKSALLRSEQLSAGRKIEVVAVSLLGIIPFVGVLAQYGGLGIVYDQLKAYRESDSPLPPVSGWNYFTAFGVVAIIFVAISAMAVILLAISHVNS